jgi:hypothetical protein
MHDAGEYGFGGGEISLARLEFALKVSAFDADQLLACVNMISRTDQHFGHGTGCRRTERQYIATALNAPDDLRIVGGLGRDPTAGPVTYPAKTWQITHGWRSFCMTPQADAITLVRPGEAKSAAGSSGHTAPPTG